MAERHVLGRVVNKPEVSKLEARRRSFGRDLHRWQGEVEAQLAAAEAKRAAMCARKRRDKMKARKAEKRRAAERAAKRTVRAEEQAARAAREADEQAKAVEQQSAETVLQHLPKGGPFTSEDVTSRVPLIVSISACISSIWVILIATLWIVHGLYVTVTGPADLPAEETAAGWCNNMPPPLPPPLPAPDSSTEPPRANVATTAAADTAASALRLEIRVGWTWHVLAIHEAGRATVATLREALLQRLHLRLAACRLVPVPASGGDVRTDDETALLLDVLGGSRQLDVLARLCGGGGKNEAAPEGKTKAKIKKKEDNVHVTIAGLGLGAHVGPDVPADAGARDPRNVAAKELSVALTAVFAENVRAVSVTVLIATAALYLWIQELAVGNFVDLDATAITGAFGTELSAKAFGSGLFTAASGRSKGNGNEKLPELLKLKLREMRSLFRENAHAAAAQLLGQLAGQESGLARALKDTLGAHTFADSKAGSAVLIAAGQSFGTTVRNHMKADSKRAVKRLLFQAVREALLAAKIEFKDKVRARIWSFSSFHLFAVSSHTILRLSVL